MSFSDFSMSLRRHSFEEQPIGLALEFTLPFPVGQDLNGVPTNAWTVVLAPRGSGIFQIWTTYPGQPSRIGW